MKTCKDCGIEKEVTEYASGRAVCKPCFAAKQKKKDRKCAAKSVEWDAEYHRDIATTQRFIDAAAKLDLQAGTADKLAYILASIIERLSWDDDIHGYAACVPWKSLDQLYHDDRVNVAVKKLLAMGVLKAVEGKYDVYIVKVKDDSYKRVLAMPKHYIDNTLKEDEDEIQEMYDILGETDSERYEESFPGAYLVQYWNVVGHEQCVDWRHSQYPYWTMKSETTLSTIVCNTTQPERFANENVVDEERTAYVDPLFHGVDWWRVMAVAQNDVNRISVDADAFEFDDEGYIVDLSQEVKDQFFLKKTALIELRNKTIAEQEDKGYSFPPLMPEEWGKENEPEDEEAYEAWRSTAQREAAEGAELWEEAKAEAYASLYRGQLNAAQRVYEGRVLVRQRSNTRIHNRVSAMKPCLRAYLFCYETGEYLLPKDVNNAGIASAVYKVSHLADTHPDVAQFIQDAKGGEFYEKAYNWLADNGVVFESAFKDGGKDEVKYGTRAGRTDYENVCSGVLPHLYHSGNAAYDWLAEQGCEVDNSKRRNMMHDWAYANYPNVYAVIDEAKRQVAEEWLVGQISKKKFRDRYRRFSVMKDALDCGSTVEEIAEDWFLTAPFKRWNDDGEQVDTGYAMYLKMATKVRDGLAAGKTLFEISMPSAMQVREQRITSRVSRSIHDCETAGQWQGALAHKEEYPDSVVVSIHDCIMTDTDVDHLGDCLVWGWANCLYNEDTDEFYGVDVSVDDDDH